jgi:hypothetical protein
MTNRQIDKLRTLFPAGETLDRLYSAYEGGIRAVTKDAAGNETRYLVHFAPDGKGVSIERF